MPDKKEIRYFPIEMRVDQEGVIEGYAAIFDKWSEDLGWFRERIRSGAFKNTIKKEDIRALFNHDANQVLGRNKAKTLELSEDKKGLEFLIDPPETQWANDLLISIKRGDIDQASFGFTTIRDEWDYDKDPMERTLIEVKLFDVSVVTYPAYPQTSVSARSLAEMFIARVRSQGDDIEVVQYMRDRLEEINVASELEEGQAEDDELRSRESNLKRKKEIEQFDGVLNKE